MTGFPAGRYVGTCECGKRNYPTRKDAKAAISRIEPAKTMHVYRHGDWFHVGHIPKAVATGQRSSAAYAERQQKYAGKRGAA